MNVAIYAVAHMFVDCACAFAMYGAFMGWQNAHIWILVYNYCAFALQMPLGALVDGLRHRGKECSREFALAGVILTGVGIFTHPAVLGIGNALFHVGGGVGCMLEDERRGRQGKDFGVFVAPGALGLFLGTKLATGFGTPNSWMYLLVCVALGLSMITICWMVQSEWKTAQVLSVPAKRHLPMVLMLCFLVVGIRSYVGLNSKFEWNKTTALALIATLAIAAGKAGGGFARAKVGTGLMAVVTLIPAAVCFGFGHLAVMGILALFLFQMTMPVTLYLPTVWLPKWKGLIFGLMTFALFLGYLPRYLHAPAPETWILGVAASLISLLMILIMEGIGNVD